MILTNSCLMPFDKDALEWYENTCRRAWAFNETPVYGSIYENVSYRLVLRAGFDIPSTIFQRFSSPWWKWGWDTTTAPPINQINFWHYQKTNPVLNIINIDGNKQGSIPSIHLLISNVPSKQSWDQSYALCFLHSDMSKYTVSGSEISEGSLFVQSSHGTV